MNIHTSKKGSVFIGGILVSVIAAVLVLYSSDTPAWETSNLGITIDNLNLIDSKRVSRTDYEYTYTVDLTNLGPDAAGIPVTITSTSSHTTIVDGKLVFGVVARGTTVTSADTFTIRQDRRYPFDPNALEFYLGAVQALALQEVDSPGAVGDEFVGIQGTDRKGNVITVYVAPELYDAAQVSITDGHFVEQPPDDHELITNGYIQVSFPPPFFPEIPSSFPIRIRSGETPTRVWRHDSDRQALERLPFYFPEPGVVEILVSEGHEQIIDNTVTFALLRKK